MSDAPLLRGSGPTSRERALAFTGLAAIAIAGLLQGMNAPVGGGLTYQGGALDPNAPRAVVLAPGQTVLVGLETPQTEVLAAQVRPAPLHRREVTEAEAAPVQIIAEAPPPAMSATEATADAVAVEPAAPSQTGEPLIQPEAPSNLRPAR